MAITFGNTSSGGASWSHNNDGDFLLVTISSTTNDVTGVTFDGVAMTQVGTALTNTQYARFISMWSLTNPNSGSLTVAVTGGTNEDSLAASMSGVNQTTPYTALNTAAGTSATPAITLTTTATGSYIVGHMFSGTPGASAGTDTTALIVDYQGIFRSTNAVDSASGTLNVNHTSAEWNFKAFSLNPPAVANTTNFFAMM